MKMEDKLTYICIPYTFNPDYSFNAANTVTTRLMSEGKVVFSPISHSHVLSRELHPHKRHSADFWLSQDLPILRKCDELIVVILPEDGLELIEKSVGCQAEINCAREMGIPITYIYF